jgi:hypothetical protein
MSVVGWIAVVLVIIAALIGIGVLLRSIPDIRRYLAIRKM